ncbi:class B sortase [Anaeromicropila herbilytica]|uniref:Uncharacterized protein n=1 Tax=Anaeromicropila herbilytica TaxID=2785025 RepID=A0A7R7EPT9_9FIRM|nr:class B sortase [Anaeromicropila herbilytica]BCN32814.1 hypothetical protein bsdtb5_41090 [Anaeromicropila herbilytica]
MKKENKIILLVCVTIVINCIIVIMYSTEIKKRIDVVTEQSNKIEKELSIENNNKIQSTNNNAKNNIKNSSKVSTNNSKSKNTTKGNKKEELNTDIQINDQIENLDQEGSDESQEAKDNSSSATKTDMNQPKDKAIYKQLLSAQKANPNVVAFITIKDTNIQYPVLKGDRDNSYLHKDLTGQYSEEGSIVLDGSINVSDANTVRNLVIRGNNTKKGNMFADLVKYKDENFYREHQYIYYQQQDKLTKWKVFAVYYIDGNDQKIPTAFKDDSEFADYLLHCQRQSIFTTDNEVSMKDSIITLVTDSFEYANGKTIVQAALVVE